MLLLGRGRQRTCRGFARREFLQIGGSTVLGLSMADAFRAQEYGHGPAKSVIFLWLWGGPAQLDTWDPKPNAPMEYRGPFSSIPTRVVGTRIGELLPDIA